MLYEELPSHDYPISQTSQNSMRPLKDYVLKLSITINILIIWSAIQGIISFQIGKNFNSSLLIAFGISSFSQIIIILYIYYKLLTDHYKSTLIHTRNYFDSRKKIENLIVIFGIIIFIILAIITIFIDFYAIKKEKDHPKKPLPPGTIPPFNNHSVSRIPWQLLAFGIYILHPYIALIFTTWYLSFSQRSEVLNEASNWVGLYLPNTYAIFIYSQLLFNKWHEVIFTLIIALMFVVYAIILGWTYLQNEKSNIGSEILYSSEIEDLEEE
ncbi:hypothetical protein GLOIN_2v1884975 [Rhizophagus irregularis DAOM 181602=DAOM 197198]|uniref:Uncharacterized protein n=1 Tax=Rhizophagus irregularis (strain DAOM 181602 / DAOM 197198 / MUCL 43194) TaxID=747089 RepID=U9TUN0_RHIID|nr:hypothetical protein GLOIN_2v1884975 [Rhizophagus irregularis DAOM 181602=DAOM 197198]POG59552.1 hypothetical protein GLOIN_2v1884975 [Rhizophagus irregularis DAOM 181602=DAOM 197198]GBC38390.1 hypothetical protein GLOIN_2v1884975 [Rhizophagus irregularis DAOM 181602=DAOM 197198]|eukprot:XP_025166418.1 hypothetical protein GLOIN_2v1884975 [Rhizophagus irregularis DAOM 181602=DAOM 197198]